MNNKLEVIGIDHGWSMMKTVTQVFVTGVKEITTTPALFGDVLEYDGKYYKIGTVRQLNGEVDETEIQNIMRYGRSDIDDEYLAIIKAEIEDFVEKVYNSIREFSYNLKTTPIVFVGGGAVVMKNFSNHEAKNISYILDVKANARGYEQLAIMGLKTAKRLA